LLLDFFLKRRILTDILSRQHAPRIFPVMHPVSIELAANSD
jgi:hypothetical protein